MNKIKLHFLIFFYFLDPDSVSSGAERIPVNSTRIRNSAVLWITNILLSIQNYS